MNAELQQNVLNAAGQKASAAIASGGTIITGVSTYLQLIPSVIGAIASLVGLVLSAVLTYSQIKKGRLERKQLHLQITVLKEKEAERLERAEQRRAKGYPVRRLDDDAHDLSISP